MKYLCIGEKYEKGGEEKTSWKRIGEMFEGKSGKSFIKLYHIPNTIVSIFEAEKQESKSSPKLDAFGADLDTPF
jgi:hypothetical protein